MLGQRFSVGHVPGESIRILGSEIQFEKAHSRGMRYSLKTRV